MKVNLVAKIMQSTYLSVIFHVKYKKLIFLAVLTWFSILGKIQDGSQDGDHCCWRHVPLAAQLPLKYTSSCSENQRIFAKGKIVSKYRKLRGTGPSSPPLVPRWGYEFASRPRVKVVNNFLVLNHFCFSPCSSWKYCGSLHYRKVFYCCF